MDELHRLQLQALANCDEADAPLSDGLTGDPAATGSDLLGWAVSLFSVKALLILGFITR